MGARTNRRRRLRITRAIGAVVMLLTACAEPGSLDSSPDAGDDSFPNPIHAQYVHTWSQLIGGSGNSQVFATVVDPATDATYAVGSFDGEARFGEFVLTTSAFSTDMFLAKFDAAGDVLWAKQYGSPGNDEGVDVAVDASGQLYTIGTLALDAVVRRVDPDTGDDVWARTFGSPTTVDPTTTDVAFSIETNGTHAIISLGTRGTVSLGPGFTFTNTAAFGYDIVMAGLNADDGSAAWAKHYPATGTELVNASALDLTANRLVVTGSVDQDADLGTGPLGSEGLTDIFVGSYSAVDGTPIWTRSFGADGFESGEGIAVDSTGNVYVTGYHGLANGGGVDFGSGPLATHGGADCFVAKLSGAGDLLWAQGHGGQGDDYARDVAVGSDGHIAIVGQFQLNPNFGSAPLVSAGQFDAFLAGYAANGQPLWSGAYGGLVGDKGFAIAAGQDGGYVAGGFTLHQIDFGGGALTTEGFAGGFLAKFRSVVTD